MSKEQRRLVGRGESGLEESEDVTGRVCAGPLGASWSRKRLATNRQGRKDSLDDLLGFSPRSVTCYLHDSESRVFKLGHASESRGGQGEGCDNLSWASCQSV